MAAASASTIKPLILQEKEFPAQLQTVVDARFRVVIAPGFATTEPIQAVLSVGHEPITGATLDALPALPACVSNFGVGYDHVDEAACTERGVLVGNTPGVLTDATAEMAVALLLAHARRIVEGDKRARDPALRKIDSGWFGKQVSGSMVGIVGLGRIGEAIAKRCVALGASVCYHKRSRAPVEVEAALGGAQFHASLDGLLGCCNFVVLCCPFSAATAQLISAPQLKRLLPGAVLVNIGRGGLVDQLAVAAALESGALGGYATDVTDPEPLPVGHPLLAAPRTTITPHTGSATLQTRTAMLNLALDNIAAAIAGTPMPACPNARDIAARKPESH